MTEHRPITPTAELAEAFWLKVAVGHPDECWPYIAGSARYPYFYFGGEYRLAHRVAYALTYGDPGDLEVHHTCETKRCSNPDHLVAATHAGHAQAHATTGSYESWRHERQDGLTILPYSEWLRRQA